MSVSAASDIGVLIAAHGERGGNADNAVLAKVGKQVTARVPNVAVATGALSGEPAIEEAAASLAARGCRRALLYPFFMSDGYFVRTVVPQRLSAAGVAIVWQDLPPFGFDPKLPALIVETAKREALAVSWEPAATRLVLVGHGSTRSRASAEATLAAATAAGRLGPFAAVEASFLEEAPLAGDMLSSGGRTIVVGFMSGEGLHGRDDIMELVAAAGGDVRYTGPIGAADAAGVIVADAVQRALADARGMSAPINLRPA